MKLVEELFGVNYSNEQIRRILVDKLGMNCAKSFVRDCRRLKGVEDILAERVKGAINNLKPNKDDKRNTIKEASYWLTEKAGFSAA